MTSPARTFDQWLAAHERGVARVCRSVLHEEHLVLDAVQETFVRLWRRLGAGGPEPSGAWVRRAALSAAIDLARSRGLRDRVEDLRRSESPDLVPRGQAPPERAAAAELAERLEAAVAELSEGQRAVFRLRHEGGLSLREVGDALGLSTSTAKTHFARACLKLQERLSAHRTDPDETRPR